MRDVSYDPFSDAGLRALSIDQVVDLTGLCRPGVYREIREGRLIARKIGRRTFVIASDLREFLHSCPRLKTSRQTP